MAMLSKDMLYHRGFRRVSHSIKTVPSFSSFPTSNPQHSFGAQDRRILPQKRHTGEDSPVSLRASPASGGEAAGLENQDQAIDRSIDRGTEVRSHDAAALALYLRHSPPLPHCPEFGRFNGK
jgi:hypothetical protein